MKSIIRKILKEEQQENIKALTTIESYLFKQLNKENAIKFGDKKLGDTISDLFESFGKEVTNLKYYIALYRLNYREAGDYQNLTKDDFVDPRKYHSQKTTNKKSSEFTKSKMPFQGSNLKGNWLRDGKGVEYYVIKSYNWYPLYLYKDDRWYEVLDKYSSSTAKQMSAANPIGYNNELAKKVIMVTPEEMVKLERGATYDEIMKGKVQKLIKDKGSVIDQKNKYITRNQENTEPTKIRFKIDDVDQEGDKAIVHVLIDDAGKTEGRKLIPSKGGYLRNELPGVSKESIEKTVKLEILYKLKEYIGPWIRPWDELDLSSTNVDFKFKHIHETI